MNKELEAKYFIEDKSSIREQIKNLGLELIKPEFLMKRKVFDKGEKSEYIRVRDEGDKITMTFKCISGTTIDCVEEAEITVSSFEEASTIINQTNFKEKSYQENLREIWRNEEVEIVIDEWPYLQPYIEIEAKSKEIVEKYSKLLGFDISKDAFFGAVGVLYEKQYGIPVEELIKIPKMVFNDSDLLENLSMYNKTTK